jgi:hypothetical protein
MKNNLCVSLLLLLLLVFPFTAAAQIRAGNTFGLCAPIVASNVAALTDTGSCSVFRYTLNVGDGNITSETLTTFRNGKLYVIEITGDGTRTWTWTGGLFGSAPPVIIDAAITTSFACYYNGTTCVPADATSAAFSQGAVQAAPAAPTSGLRTWLDNTTAKNRLSTIDTSGIVTSTLNMSVDACAGAGHCLWSTPNLTPNSDKGLYNYLVDADATATFTVAVDAGTPINGQQFILKINCSNTPGTITWTGGAKGFAGGTDVALPTACSGSGKTDYFGFIYDTVNTIWHCVAVGRGY